MFRKEDASTLAGFHAVPLPGRIGIWRVEIFFFVKRGKPENPGKKVWTNNKPAGNPYMTPSWETILKNIQIYLQLTK